MSDGSGDVAVGVLTAYARNTKPQVPTMPVTVEKMRYIRLMRDLPRFRSSVSVLLMPDVRFLPWRKSIQISVIAASVSDKIKKYTVAKEKPTSVLAAPSDSSMLGNTCMALFMPKMHMTVAANRLRRRQNEVADFSRSSREAFAGTEIFVMMVSFRCGSPRCMDKACGEKIALSSVNSIS